MFSCVPALFVFRPASVVLRRLSVGESMLQGAAGTYCDVSQRLVHTRRLLVFLLHTEPLELHKSNTQRMRETVPASLSG